MLAGSFVFSGCESDAKAPATSTTTAPAPPPMPKEDQVSVPKFDMDSAYAFVAAQVAFGPRVMNTAAHDAAGEWMADKLEELGAKVERQPFTAAAYDGTPLKGMNIIGRYNPEMEDRILLAAHWDTRQMADSPLETDPNAVVNGADDGASGVGVLLKLPANLGNRRHILVSTSYCSMQKTTEIRAAVTPTPGGWALNTILKTSMVFVLDTVCC